MGRLEIIPNDVVGARVSHVEGSIAVDELIQKVVDGCGGSS